MNESNVLRAADVCLPFLHCQERVRADIAARRVQRCPAKVPERPRPPRLQRHPPTQGCGARATNDSLGPRARGKNGEVEVTMRVSVCHTYPKSLGATHNNDSLRSPYVLTVPTYAAFVFSGLHRSWSQGTALVVDLIKVTFHGFIPSGRFSR